ncbi:MAG: hypothetical protein WDZ35_02735 [Crocinitomicaceae bacterium]
MRVMAVIFLFLVPCIISFGQKNDFVASDSIMGDFDQLSVDNFGRIYLVKNDVITLFSKELDTLFTTSLKSIRPTSIESSKSFRTLLFDRDRSVIQFLDNTLTDIHGEIDLVNLDIQQPQLVCESFAGNTIWVLDAGSFRLVKLNAKLEKVLITENLMTIFDGDEMPTQMIESNDFLYVLIPGKGIAFFDIFGTFYTIYPCKAEAIDAMGNYLFVKLKGEIQVIPTDEKLLMPEFSYPLPQDVIDFKFSRQHLYLLKKNGLFIGNFRSKK